MLLMGMHAKFVELGKSRKKRSSSNLQPGENKREEQRTMVRVATFFAMSFGAFLFWQSMDKLHVWIALHQDEKRERLEREKEIQRVRKELLAQAKQNDSLA